MFNLLTSKQALLSLLALSVTVWRKQLWRLTSCWSLQTRIAMWVWILPHFGFQSCVLSLPLMPLLDVDLMEPRREVTWWCWLLGGFWSLRRTFTISWIGGHRNFLGLPAARWLRKLKLRPVLLTALSLFAGTLSTSSSLTWLWPISWKGSHLFIPPWSPMPRPCMTATIVRVWCLQWLIAGSAWKAGW